MHQAYKTTMLQGDQGHGMAMVVFLLLMLAAIITFQFTVLREKD